METRTCIKKALEDLEKYGAEKIIKVERMDVVTDNKFCGYLCNYELVNEVFKASKDSNRDVYIYTSTIYDFIYGDGSPLITRRLYNTSALQENLVPENVINNELLNILKGAEIKAAHMDITVKKAVGLDNATTKYYLDSLSNMCDNYGIVVPIEECCEQDIKMFGENNACYAKIKCKDGFEILTDWVIYPCLANVNFDKGSDSEYYIEMTLKNVSNILLDQSNGIFREARKAKILKIK